LTVNGNYLLSFYDNKHRPIIIIKAKSVDSFGKILQQMKSDKYMNPSQALHLTE